MVVVFAPKRATGSRHASGEVAWGDGRIPLYQQGTPVPARL